jgi:L-ascorbate metabolism protein UlaG (beta-lactamase superfamily)
LPDSPVTVDELADADVVAVTHAGYDHRAQAIDVTLAGNAVLVCGTALYGAALDAGVPAGRCAGIVSGSPSGMATSPSNHSIPGTPPT